MSQTSRNILITFGIAWTVMMLVIGCFAARVTIFTCIRERSICRSEQSTVFLPWHKRVHTIAIQDIQQAESQEKGEIYTLVLRSTNNEQILSIPQTESSLVMEKFVNRINSFLRNPKTNNFTIKQGADLQSTMILGSFCACGLIITFYAFIEKPS